jgi:hypothetical protein
MTMEKSVLAALALFALAAALTPAAAWDVLGVRDVGDRGDHDTIHLDGHRQFSHIRICVERHPVRFYDVNVMFNNGGRQEVPVRARINPGGCTRVIELNGAPRDVSEINFYYEALTARRRISSTVTVSGE